MKRLEVVDACGVFMHNTYERRARGLVKKGRAQFLTASKICLRPLPEKLEEKTLETNNKKDILTRIDTILQQKEYLQEAFSAIEKIPHDLNEELTAIRTKTILEIVEAREKTNQEVVALLRAMLEQDVTPQGE
ncbi:MAG: hypothetical protein ACLRL6_01195 [Clostridium sp.]